MSFEREIVHYTTCVSMRARQGKYSDREGDAPFACVDVDDVMAPSSGYVACCHALVMPALAIFSPTYCLISHSLCTTFAYTPND